MYAYEAAYNQASNSIILRHDQISVFSVCCQEKVVRCSNIQKILTFEVKYHEILYLSYHQKEPKGAKIFWNISAFCVMLVERYELASYRICWYAFFDIFWPLLPSVSIFCIKLDQPIKQATYRIHWLLAKCQWILYNAYLHT